MQLLKVAIPPCLFLIDNRKETSAFKTDTGLRILKSIDNTPKCGWLLHVSLSREDCFPFWEEITEIKEHFFGDIDVMLIIPKEGDIRGNCLHLWEMPQEWEMEI